MSSQPVAVGWINAGFSLRFTLLRCASVLAFTTIPFAVCLLADQGLLGVCFMAIGAWPYRFRFEARDSGLAVRWLFLHHSIAWEELQQVEVILDTRAHVVGRRRPRLRAHRTHGAHFVIDAPREQMERLASAISSRLQAQDQLKRTAQSEKTRASLDYGR